MIGSRLRHIRMAKKLGVREVASKMKRSPSYLVSLEKGLVRMTPEVLNTVYDAIGLEPLEAEKISATADLINWIESSPNDSKGYHDGIHARIKRIETLTSVRRVYSSSFIPGPLLLPGSIKANYKHFGLSDDDVARLMQSATSRSEVLTKVKQRNEFILSANVLFLRAGTPAVVAEQLKHLAGKVAEGKEFYGVLPFGSMFSMTPSFTILDKEVAWTGLLDRLQPIMGDARIAGYITYFDRMRDDPNLLTGIELRDALLVRARNLAKMRDWPDLGPEDWPM